MARAGKGTVQRRFTVDSYAAELEALYKDTDALKDREVPVKFNPHDLEKSVQQLLAFTTGIKDLNRTTTSSPAAWLRCKSFRQPNTSKQAYKTVVSKPKG